MVGVAAASQRPEAQREKAVLDSEERKAWDLRGFCVSTSPRTLVVITGPWTPGPLLVCPTDPARCLRTERGRLRPGTFLEALS